MRTHALVLVFLAFALSASAQEVPFVVVCHVVAPAKVVHKPSTAGPRGAIGPIGPAGPAGQVPEWYLWIALGGVGLGLLGLGLAIGALAGNRAPAQAPVVVVNYPGAVQAPAGPHGPGDS